MAGAVEVVTKALMRAWRQADYDELWLQFQPRPARDVFAEVEEAVTAANQAAQVAAPGDAVFVEGVSDSDAGPVALMSRAGPEEGVLAWLNTFARHLESLGAAGRVTAAPQAQFPSWMSGWTPLPRQLTAFVSYGTTDLSALDETQRRAQWNLTHESTEAITSFGVDWAKFRGADVFLRRSIHTIRTKNLEVAGPLADGVERHGLAGVTYLRSEPRRTSSVQLHTNGGATFSVMDDSVPWHVRLRKVTVPLLKFPGITDLAFVRYSNHYTLDWDNLSYEGHPLPHVCGYHLRYNRHLHSRYTPDAHGLQVLTAAHLGHARDLSDWIIKPLADGRHLVQAKDLEPWFAQPEVDPDVLARARDDFGDMILTPETIAANPPPWN